MPSRIHRTTGLHDSAGEPHNTKLVLCTTNLRMPAFSDKAAESNTQSKMTVLKVTKAKVVLYSMFVFKTAAHSPNENLRDLIPDNVLYS